MAVFFPVGFNSQDLSQKLKREEIGGLPPPDRDINTPPKPATGLSASSCSQLASVNTVHVCDKDGETNLSFCANKNVLNSSKDDTNESETSVLSERYAWFVTLARHVLVTCPKSWLLNCIRFFGLSQRRLSSSTS